MKNTLLILCLFLSFGLFAQSGINTKKPIATLELKGKGSITSSTKEAIGFLAPKISGEILHLADLNNVYGEDQDGTLAFVTEPPVPNNRVGQTIDIDKRGYYYFDFQQNKWIKPSFLKHTNVKVDELLCNEIEIADVLFFKDQYYSGKFYLPYKGGNGEPYPLTMLIKNGLTFYIPEGTLNNGDGILEGYIVGTPETSGALSVLFSFANKSCNININVSENIKIDYLNCATAQLSPNELIKDSDYSGTLTIPYKNGNGVQFPSTSFSYYGLTFTLDAGILANGDGNLIFKVSGKPTVTGNYSIPINFMNFSCALDLNFKLPIGKITNLNCNDVSFQPYLLTQDEYFYGSIEVPYDNGNGGAYPESSFVQNGLKFTLLAGSLKNGSGILTYIVEGTPNTSGIVNFDVFFNNISCSFESEILPGKPQIKDLICNDIILIPNNLKEGVYYEGALEVSYTGGNGQNYSEATFVKYGLTFKLLAGKLSSTGKLIYEVSGTPFVSGNQLFEIIFLDKICYTQFPITLPDAQIQSLDCTNAKFELDKITQGVVYNGTLKISYVNGNGGTYPDSEFESNGLKFKLHPGTLKKGSGELTYYVSGIPTVSGPNEFVISFKDVSCILTKNVLEGKLPQEVSFNCTQVVFNPSEMAYNVNYQGTMTISYINGNGWGFGTNTFTHNGLTFTLQPGQLNIGSGELIYQVNGTPTVHGNTTIPYTLLGKSCNINAAIILPAAISNFTCNKGVFSPSIFIKDLPYVGKFTLPYTGGNGGVYKEIVITQGDFTFTLPAGTINVGDGELVFDVTGTPKKAGNVNLPITVFQKSCNLSVTVLLQGTITDLVCNTIILDPNEFFQSVPYQGTLKVSYNGGNGGAYNATSLTYNGLTFYLKEGVLNNGSGELIFEVSGKALNNGVIQVPLMFLGITCDVTLDVKKAPEVEDILCNLAVFDSPYIYKFTPYQGTLTVPYKNGNGEYYPAATIYNYQFTYYLPAGKLNNGDGNLVYTVTSAGRNAAGGLQVPINAMGKECTVNHIVYDIPEVYDYNCETFSNHGGVKMFYPYPQYGKPMPANSTLEVPYLTSNGMPYGVGEPFSVGGLTFTLKEGVLNEKGGKLIYDVTGTPNRIIFNVYPKFFGLGCVIPVGLSNGREVGVYDKVWKLHNVGVNTNLHPEPQYMSSEYWGNFYKWGRWEPYNYDKFGGAIAGWKDIPVAAKSDWSTGYRTSNDPCPNGFKVPTRYDYEQLYKYYSTNWNHAQFGTTNAAKRFYLSNFSGNSIILPAAGQLSASNGKLTYDYIYGKYFTSSNSLQNNNPVVFSFNTSNVTVTNSTSRKAATPIRCVSVNQYTIY